MSALQPLTQQIPRRMCEVDSRLAFATRRWRISGLRGGFRPLAPYAHVGAAGLFPAEEPHQPLVRRLQLESIPAAASLDERLEVDLRLLLVALRRVGEAALAARVEVLALL